MKHIDWTVKPNDDGIRPAGPHDACCYCRSKIGGTHGAECVIRRRTVVIKVELELVVKVPEYWDQDQVEFSYNESSSCKNNLVDDIKALTERLGKHNCICGLANVEFMREATAEDEEAHQLRASDRAESPAEKPE